MKTLLVGFSSANTILSRLIRFFSDSHISHCYIRIPVPEYDTSVIFHAQTFNTHYKNYSYFLEKASVVDEIEVQVSDEQFASAEKVRVMECGKPYGYKELIGYVWVLIGRKFGKKWKNPLFDSDTYVCVELVCRCLGIKDSGTLTPQDLYSLLKK